MSRIGNLPVTIASGVEVKVSDKNLVTIKGPKGELSQQVDPDLIIKVEDGQLTVSRPTDQKRHRSVHGLYRSLLNNIVTGVTEGYKIELELVGVGYRAESAGQLLQLQLGFSHPIHFAVPDEVKLTTEMKKGNNPAVVLESTDKQLIGQIAAKIRAFRKPEPYKGKGVLFKGEVIRRKAGKTAG